MCFPLGSYYRQDFSRIEREHASSCLNSGGRPPMLEPVATGISLAENWTESDELIDLYIDSLAEPRAR
jgi:hypothetical protein